MLDSAIMSNSYGSSSSTEVTPKSVHSLEEVLKSLSVFILTSITPFCTTPHDYQVISDQL